MLPNPKDQHCVAKIPAFGKDTKTESLIYRSTKCSMKYIRKVVCNVATWQIGRFARNDFLALSILHLNPSHSPALSKRKTVWGFDRPILSTWRRSCVSQCWELSGPRKHVPCGKRDRWCAQREQRKGTTLKSKRQDCLSPLDALNTCQTDPLQDLICWEDRTDGQTLSEPFTSPGFIKMNVLAQTPSILWTS